MTTLVYEQQRAFDDLLLAERQLRAQSESQVRELRQLLLETAVRLDGQRFEAIRREDPSVPYAWKVSDWSAFMKNIPGAQGWGASVVPSSAPSKREKVLIQQVEALKSQLDDAFAQLEQERGRVEAANRSIAEMAEAIRKAVPGGDVAPAEKPELPNGISLSDSAMPKDLIPALAFIIEDVKTILKGLPKRPPAGFKGISGGNRTGGDLDAIFLRYWIVIYLMGRWRLSASMEIDFVIGFVDDISPRSGSLKSILGGLIDAGMILQEKLEMETPKTVLKVNRLSENGEKLYMELFKEKPLENEWSRLIQMGYDEQRLLMTLFFTMHARKCGWTTQLSSSEAVTADVWIGKGAEAHHVDITLDRNDTWRNLAKLDGGKVAIFAGTADLRQRLSADCKLDKVPGMANDIETLAMMKYKGLDHTISLWAEEW